MSSSINITFNGDVLDLHVELEGKEIGLYPSGDNNWSRTLQNFKIEDKLDVSMLCKGLNGTAWRMEITVNGNKPRQYSGTIADGYSRVSDEIPIN